MSRVLSIVIPSYNQAVYLEQAILSVLRQDDENIRVAVVDGGSTDGSLQIIHRYASRLDYWCSEPDGGQTAAILKGFDAIGGDIRGWLNSDDEYVDGAFAKVRSVFGADDSLLLVYGERILIDAQGRVLGWTRTGPFDPEISGYSIPSETAFWTREGEEQVGSLDPSLRFAMDLDFFTRLFIAGKSRKLNSYLGRFRCHDESKSATIGDVGASETAALWKKYFGDSETWRVPIARRPALHLLAGLRHPRLLLLPYLRQRARSRG